MTDINIIMETYVKTGMLPNYSSTPLLYVDEVNKPSFEEVHNTVAKARQHFDTLPTALKNELGNDYRMFEPWLSNPENAQRAEKLGLISIHKPKPTQSETGETPPKQNPATV